MGEVQSVLCTCWFHISRLNSLWMEKYLKKSYVCMELAQIFVVIIAWKTLTCTVLTLCQVLQVIEGLSEVHERWCTGLYEYRPPTHLIQGWVSAVWREVGWAPGPYPTDTTGVKPDKRLTSRINNISSQLKGIKSWEVNRNRGKREEKGIQKSWNS